MTPCAGACVLQLSMEAKYFNAYDKLMAGVLDLLGNRRDITILDVGAGTGLIGKRVRSMKMLANAF